SMAQSAADQPYLAKPPDNCYIAGNLHAGKPRGAQKIIEGIDPYIIYLLAGKLNRNIVLYFPNIWGLFKNGLLVIDSFADAKYLIIGLNYFRGNPV
ncbi:hypothetical protein F5883DRAFT_439543, partial [Diaporthe sp. PMI_573]